METEQAKLPAVQLIGVQKAGTSAIADWMFDQGGIQRPKVFAGEPWYYSKEVHFFDIDHRYGQGVEFYAKRFQHDEDNTCTMDATPDTFQFAERVWDIYNVADGGKQLHTVKIIVILREPISRELSLYNHLAYDVRNLPSSQITNWHKRVLNDGIDGTIMSFDEYVAKRSIPALIADDDDDDDGSGRSSRHGLYSKYLERWFELFDRSNQILVLSYDELMKNPRKIQDRIQSFLGMTIPGNIERGANSNDNIYKVKHVSNDTTIRLNSIFDSHNERLYKLLQLYPGPSMEQCPFPRFSDQT